MRLPLLALAMLSAPAFAQDARPAAKSPASSPAQSHAEAMKQEAEAGWATAPVAEQEVTHRDAVTVGGRRLPYTASAGTLTIRDIEGNLFAPAKGSAVIDGPFRSRTLSSRHTFVTSRQRDVAVLGGAALLVAGIAHLIARRTGI